MPGGPFLMGSADPAALDNERPVHEVDVAGVLDRRRAGHQRPVPAASSRTAATTTRAGGATRAGRGARRPALVAPQFWRRDGDGWARLRFGTVEPLPDDEPVQHVGWYEADAYARWAGRRLPTEAEWEKAAVFDPDTGDSRRWPWGDEPPTAERANLGQRHLGPAPVGAYPAGVSAVGCHQMVGDVWEWTASDFRAYPGFEWFPYAEYSDVFYGGDYKVLRGSSWATDPSVGPHHVPQLGPPDPPPDLRRLPHRTRQLDRRCAATWPTWARPARSPRCSTSPRTRSSSRAGSRCASAPAP